MKKIVFENEIYYFNQGKVYKLDGGLYEVPTIISNKVLKFYYSSIEYKKLEEVELLEYLKSKTN